jgi:D-alanine--poly(phosphoribitol) ligase subunit 1
VSQLKAAGIQPARWPTVLPMKNQSPGTIHAAVRRVASRQPDRLALLGDDDTALSYRQLDSQADKWAARLAGLGVGRGSFVPVLMPRTPRLAVALLAVLKCGAAYTVLDRRWPDDRISAILQPLAPPMLVSDHADGRFGVRVWNPPAIGSPPPSADLTEPVRADVDGDAPASVFFTSGTTGDPKGVLSPHRATTRLFVAGGPMAFGPGCVMPQEAPGAWDIFSLELWGMLTTGGTSVMVTDDYLPPHRLASLIARRGVNTLWLTASLFNVFVAEDIGCFAGLRDVYIGGERLSVAHVRIFVEKHPEIRLCNGYGPVESCIFATTHAITRADCDATYGIPIGRPVPGTRILVAEDGQVCGVGTQGELCIAGEGLALGYLGDEALTRAKFTEVSVDGRAVRVYRTGDLGLQDDEGVYHFIGRADRQIKLRGHRIELEGVEAQARAIAGVMECAAVPLLGALGGYERIALYYTVHTETGATTPDSDPFAVRQKLARRLPAYAVPDLVAVVGRLPLSANGKVDYAALAQVVPEKRGALCD